MCRYGGAVSDSTTTARCTAICRVSPPLPAVPPPPDTLCAPVSCGSYTSSGWRSASEHPCQAKPCIAATAATAVVAAAVTRPAAVHYLLQFLSRTGNKQTETTNSQCWPRRRVTSRLPSVCVPSHRDREARGRGRVTRGGTGRRYTADRSPPVSPPGSVDPRPAHGGSRAVRASPDERQVRSS